VTGPWRAEDPLGRGILSLGTGLDEEVLVLPDPGAPSLALGARSLAAPEAVLVPSSGQGFEIGVPSDLQAIAGGRVPRSHRWARHPGTLRLRAGTDGKPVLFTRLPLADYLVGVLAGELPAASPAEALRAQAILAREYALAHLEDLTDDPKVSQAFPGMPPAAAERTLRAAVESTRGLRLVDAGGRALPGYWYHSTCGGATTTAASVFGVPPTPEYAGVACPHCAASKYARWTAEVPETEVRKAAGFGSPVIAVEIADRTPDGRALRLRLRTAAGSAKEVPAASLRAALDVNRVRSTLLDSVEPQPAGSARPAGFRFSGRGWGHGVGMCQVGACGLAASGKRAEEILAFYYPGVRVVRAEGPAGGGR